MRAVASAILTGVYWYALLKICALPTMPSSTYTPNQATALYTLLWFGVFLGFVTMVLIALGV